MSVEAAHKDNIPVLDKQLQIMALAGISPQLKRHEMQTEQKRSVWVSLNRIQTNRL